MGRIIEHKTGAAYDDAVRKLVLEPAGIKRTILGRTLERFRAKDEVHYYHHTPTEQARSIFSYTPRRVPWPYGGFHLEAMDAHGGWISSPVDLVRFVTALDKSRGKGLVTDDSMKQMLAPPPKPLGRSGRSHYGLGWMVGRDGDDPVYWHTGSLSGTATILVRTGGPMAWAATFNTRPADAAYRADVDDGLHRAAREVKSWPDHDLFPKLP